MRVPKWELDGGSPDLSERRKGPGTRLGGNITYVGSSCSNTGTLASDSFVAGDTVAVDATTNDTGGLTGETVFVAIINNPANPTAFTGNYQINSGACAGQTGTLTFNKQ